MFFGALLGEVGKPPQGKVGIVSKIVLQPTEVSAAVDYEHAFARRVG